MENVNSTMFDLGDSKLEAAYLGFEGMVRWIVVHSVLSRGGIFIGSVLVLQWHIRHMILGRPTGKMFRLIGIDSLIFAIYYQDNLQDLVNGKPFFFTCLLVLFDEVFLFQIGQYVYSYRTDGGGKEKDTTDVRFLATKFQDLTIRWSLIVSIFVIQLFLTLFYVLHLDKDTNSHKQEEVRFTQWLLAVLLQSLIGEDQLGSGYHKPLWDEINRLLPDKADLYEGWYCLSKETHSTFDLGMRQVLDYIVNAICRSIILSTVPILLGTEASELDFVKDCMAVFFITTLDDTKTPVSNMIEAFRMQQRPEAQEPPTPRSSEVARAEPGYRKLGLLCPTS